MTAIEKCKHDIEEKLASIERGWRKLADGPKLTSADLYFRRQEIFSEVDEFKNLIRELDRLNAPPN